MRDAAESAPRCDWPTVTTRSSTGTLARHPHAPVRCSCGEPQGKGINARAVRSAQRRHAMHPSSLWLCCAGGSASAVPASHAASAVNGQPAERIPKSRAQAEQLQHPQRNNEGEDSSTAARRGDEKKSVREMMLRGGCANAPTMGGCE